MPSLSHLAPPLRVGPAPRRGLRPAPWTVLALAIALLLLSTTPRTLSAQTVRSEEELQAAFLYRFLFFVVWPDDHATERNICVLGNDAITRALHEVDGEVVEDHRVAVRSIEVGDLEDVATSCHVLFVDSSVEREQELALLQSVATSPVLTVGESERFLSHGGIIRFVRHELRLSFEVNLDAAANATIRLRGKLLRLASDIYSAESP